jgi:hypothetical protein
VSTAAITAVAVAVVLLGSLLMVRRRSEVWRRFARHHGLEVVRGARGPKVEGDIGGRPVALEAGTSSSDRGLFAVEPVELSVEARVRPPAGFEVLPRTSLDPVVGEPGVETGDAVFDQVVRVRGDDAEQVRAWLTEARRAAVAELVEAAGRDVAGILGARLFIRRRRATSRPRRLDRDLEVLLATAQALEDFTG